MHGRVFRHDDAGWSVAYPPNGWKCRCRAQPLTASAVRRNGYEVESAEGHIQEVDVPQRDGSTIKVKRLTLPGMEGRSSPTRLGLQPGRRLPRRPAMTNMNVEINDRQAPNWQKSGHASRIPSR